MVCIVSSKADIFPFSVHIFQDIAVYSFMRRALKSSMEGITLAANTHFYTANPEQAWMNNDRSSMEIRLQGISI